MEGKSMNSNIIYKKNLCKFLSVAFLFAISCASRETPELPKAENEEIEVSQEIQKQEGALFYDNSPLSNMYADMKAKRVGDIVIVRVVENVVATNDQRKEASRRSKMKYDIGGSLSKTKGLEELSIGAGAGGENDFSAKGVQKSKNEFIASVAARVVKILPSGNLVIEGEKYIKHNSELQKLYVRGIVRPEDIMHDNSVLSTAIANARIEYISEGDFATKSKQGWLQKILDFISPF
ncbi:MAG: flagellar basal body L-ring protein FlgH [bacterium]|nr:flagellar basal body L-ring protein FlgH [bacterium]MDW8086431.1 flagellar basal body L-ring protein FlgH [Candidatus Calescibacterium sp.]